MSTTTYDDNNVFAKIIRGELPCDKIYEDEHTLAFKDIQPQAPVHVLVVPKGRYVSSADFFTQAPDREIAALMRSVAKVAGDLGLDEPGYRFLANHGRDAQQIVPHFHVHIFGGKPLGRMIKVPAD